MKKIAVVTRISLVCAFLLALGAVTDRDASVGAVLLLIVTCACLVAALVWDPKPEIAVRHSAKRRAAFMATLAAVIGVSYLVMQAGHRADFWGYEEFIMMPLFYVGILSPLVILILTPVSFATEWISERVRSTDHHAQTTC